jgi:ABC-type dipeptide/oligopeptide/nickel transport system permease subunit
MRQIVEYFVRPGMAGIWAGGVILLMILTAGLLAESIAPHDPAQQFLAKRLQGPSHEFPLGTDELGRCVLSRIIHGIRPTLGLSLGVTLFVSMVGTAVGLAAAAIPRLDGLLMRITDCFFAFPPIVLILVAVNILGPGLTGLAVALCLPGWPKYARVARSVALSLKKQTYLQAAAALGAGHGYLVRRYYLPAVLAPVLTIATIGVGGKIVYIAGMGVLGLGVQPPTAEWGSILCKGLPLLARAPNISLCAGGAIALASAAFTLSGEGLRDLLDPKGKELEALWRS